MNSTKINDKKRKSLVNKHSITEQSQSQKTGMIIINYKIQ